MESNEPRQAHSLSEPSTASGELVVRNGRQAGLRRPLLAPLTLIGRGAGCDIRLNVDGVHTQHCAVVDGTAGPIIRDLGSEAGTFVNGERITTCVLRDGDVLTVGPFEFEVINVLVELTPAGPAGRSGEIDALRIQAAAVAAQQGAMLEEEERLVQRRQTLEQQEKQLAAHLEQRRQQILEHREEVRRERTKLKEERASLDQERQVLLGEAQRDREESAQTLATIRADRDRLSHLRRRLRLRFKKEWTEKERSLRGREQQLEQRKQWITDQLKILHQERERLGELQSSANGERELARRQVREEWHKVKQAQREWQAERQSREAALNQGSALLESRSAALMAMEQDLAVRQEQTRNLRADLEREAEGLEKRIRKLRHHLTILENQTAPVEAEDAAEPRVILDEESARVLQRLEKLRGDLSDQRSALAEQWQHFLEAQESWKTQHAALLPEIEASVARLELREQQLDARAAEIQEIEDSLQHKQVMLLEQRAQVEAWKARLAAAEGEQVHERALLQGRVDQAEQTLKRYRSQLGQLRKNWNLRRKKELAQLLREARRARELQRLYTSLREEHEQRSAQLSDLERELAERVLAVKQLELEQTGKANDPPSAEKRLRKLRKQAAAGYADVEKRLSDRAKVLQAEAQRLAADVQTVQEGLEDLRVREAHLAAQISAMDQQQLNAQQSRDEQELAQARLQRTEAELRQQCQQLREELERVAGILLHEVQPVPSASRAA